MAPGNENSLLLHSNREIFLSSRLRGFRQQSWHYRERQRASPVSAVARTLNASKASPPVSTSEPPSRPMGAPLLKYRVTNTEKYN